jgi:hypothetical protein
LGVEVPLLQQFSIALFTGLVASTFIPPVRRAIPRPVEVGLWIGFVAACVVGVINVADPNAREVTASAIWGVDHVLNTMVGGLVVGIVGPIAINRFVIADWFVILAGADILALVLVRSHRQNRQWQPRVRLGEWMELPALQLSPAPGRAHAAPYALDDLNRRAAAGLAVAGAATLAGLVRFSIWIRDSTGSRGTARLAGAAQAGRAGSRAGLDSLRDRVEHLQYAARAWYAAAAAPVVTGLTVRAGDAVRKARTAERLREAAESSGKLIDIRVLLSAQSLGWYGPMLPAQSTPAPGEEEEDGSEQRPDRLAS